MITLYQYESCGYCRRVRQRMSELLLTYLCINVPRDQALRHEVLAVSGQPTVPVLVDEDVILWEEDDILGHLSRKYGQQAISGQK